jgi:rare lipoprotein A
MRRQFDLRSRHVTLLALGSLGLGGAYAAGEVLPAAAHASTGGAAGPLESGGQTRVAGVAVARKGAIGAAADVTLAPGRAAAVVPRVSATETTRNLLIGRTVAIRGAVRPLPATDGTVALEARRGGRWQTVDRARTHRGGSYRMHFRPEAPGTVRLRVLVAGAGSATRARRTLGAVNVYRKAFASWYGGSGPLACGGTLTSSTLGVASKTLPCGTMVGLRLGRRTVRVPVIDRGPYVAGREFDLTAATKRALGFGDLGTIWVTR